MKNPEVLGGVVGKRRYSRGVGCPYVPIVFSIIQQATDVSCGGSPSIYPFATGFSTYTRLAKDVLVTCGTGTRSP